MWSVSEYRTQNAICIRGTFQYKRKSLWGTIQAACKSFLHWSSGIACDKQSLLVSLFPFWQKPIHSKYYRNQVQSGHVSNLATARGHFIPDLTQAFIEPRCLFTGRNRPLFLSNSMCLEEILNYPSNCLWAQPTTYMVCLVDHLGVAWNTLMF